MSLALPTIGPIITIVSNSIIEMEDQNFSYREFALMYAVAMNHAHPYGIRTDKTCSIYIH